MAKKDYTETQTLVRKLLEKFGNTVTLTRSADVGLWERKYDPVTEEFTWINNSSGQEQTEEPADDVYNEDGVFVNIDDAMLKNSLVRVSDKMLLIEEIPEPQEGDNFTDHSGRVFKYIAHTSVNPAGVNVLWKVAVRI